MVMFSERFGYKPVKEIQQGTISDALRVRIWNLFYMSEIQSGGLASERISKALNGQPTIEVVIADKLGLNVTSAKKYTILEQIEHYLINDSFWFEVYDFIEIHLSSINEPNRQERVRQYNNLLESEKSGYRVVSNMVVPITNPSELKEIESTANCKYDSVAIHIRKALSLYSDFKKPDYENSIKESISAVEAICCIITGESGKQATLGNTLKKLKDNEVHIHPAMEKAFLSLYGYTSDESGIRHGGIDFKGASAEDAKYMLISCSAFVNYLIEKWAKVNQ